ncbi:MAG: hypothetical protein AB1609_06560 [Bacillota bacterium]
MSSASSSRPPNAADQANRRRAAEVTLRLSEFDVPPIHDCLVVGKRAAVGPEGARRMVEAVSPGQYELIRVEHPDAEAVVVRKSLLRLLPEDKLVPMLLDEFSRVGNDRLAFKVQVQVVLQVTRELEL